MMFNYVEKKVPAAAQRFGDSAPCGLLSVSSTLAYAKLLTRFAAELRAAGHRAFSPEMLDLRPRAVARPAAYAWRRNGQRMDAAPRNAMLDSPHAARTPSTVINLAIERPRSLVEIVEKAARRDLNAELARPGDYRRGTRRGLRRQPHRCARRWRGWATRPGGGRPEEGDVRLRPAQDDVADLCQFRLMLELHALRLLPRTRQGCHAAGNEIGAGRNGSRRRARRPTHLCPRGRASTRRSSPQRQHLPRERLPPVFGRIAAHRPSVLAREQKRFRSASIAR
jgi:hypothetical protein